MKFARLSFLMLAVAALGCDSSPSEPNDERYWLTSFFGSQPPISAGWYAELDASLNPTGAMCTDTLYSQYIELSRPASAQLVDESARRCDDGRARVAGTTTITGTYAAIGDTVRMTFQISDPLLGSFTWDAIRSGDRLSVPFTVYTEENPDGDHVEYIVYEKRS